MRKLIATAMAALTAGAVASLPANAAPYGSLAPLAATAASRSGVTQVRYYHRYRHGWYRASHYGGRARGAAGLPLGHGTANSPGGVVGAGSR